MKGYVPSYERRPLCPVQRRPLVERACKAVKKLIVQQPLGSCALAAKGMSGIPLASMVAYELGLGLIYVRAEGEHSERNYESSGGWHSQLHEYDYFVIVDDLVASGKTVKGIVAEAEKYANRCIGLVLYTQELAEYQLDWFNFRNIYIGED